MSGSVSYDRLFELIGAVLGGGAVGAIGSAWIRTARKPSSPGEMISAQGGMIETLGERVDRAFERIDELADLHRTCQQENRQLLAWTGVLERVLNQHGIAIPAPGSFLVVEGGHTTVFKPRPGSGDDD